MFVLRHRTASALAAALSIGLAGGAVAGAPAVSAKPINTCQPTACVPGLTIGLTTTNSKGQQVPIAGTAGLYVWGAATEPDGSILIGDYWNYRIVHYEDNEVNASGGNPATPATPASPYVFSNSTFGHGPNTNQAPFGLCVNNDPSSPLYGYVYMAEGAFYQVNEYDPNGNWVTSWGTARTRSVTTVNFSYPSQCTVDPTNGLVYIANQWGKSVVVLDPTNTNPPQFVSPPSPNTFIQPRSMAFDSGGNLWIGDEGHKRLDIYFPGPGGTLNLTVAPNKVVKAPPCDPIVPSCTSTTFDLRGLAIDATTGLAFVANGQGCNVQIFNADPSSASYGKFVANVNGVPAGGANCGTGNGQFGSGARDIAVDGNHDVWIGDLGNFRAQVFDESGNFQFAVPNPPAPPPTGGFNGPRGVAFDTSGNLYVTDTYNERIQAFQPNGSGGYAFSKQWGARGDSPATMNYPRLMCYDPLSQDSNGDVGALIVANTDSNTIVAWDTATSPPTFQWASVNPTTNKGVLVDPYGVACDPSTGYIYAANSNAKNITVFDQNGNRLGAMGGGQISGFLRGITVDTTDGSVWTDIGENTVYHFAPWASGGALIASFKNPAGSSPFGIATDANYVYVAFSSTNEVAQYDRSGNLLGVFGGAGTPVGQMKTPQGLAFGPDGDLYVVEMNNDRVSQWQVP
jgi:DNA-binding beta-propeller fold protein YncE